MPTFMVSNDLHNLLLSYEVIGSANESDILTRGMSS